MAFFPTNTGGFFDGMNIFGARQPTYLEGLLTPEELQKVQNQAMVQGLLGTAATYLAQPKNQGYGSALPYLGKAYLGGMQSAQGAYDTATQNLLTQGKLAELKREAEAAQITKQAQQELDMRLALMKLAQEAELNRAKIMKMEAEAIKLVEEAGGIKTGHDIAMLDAQIGAAKAHQDGILRSVDLMMKAMQIEGDKSNGTNEPGVPGLAGAPSDTMS